MMTLEALCLRITGLRRAELEHWIAEGWVRPDGAPGAWLFRDIDEARVRLILDLRDEMRVEEESLPVILSLIDQLYATRRHLAAVLAALERATPEETRRRIASILSGADYD